MEVGYEEVVVEVEVEVELELELERSWSWRWWRWAPVAGRSAPATAAWRGRLARAPSHASARQPAGAWRATPRAPPAIVPRERCWHARPLLIHVALPLASAISSSASSLQPFTAQLRGALHDGRALATYNLGHSSMPRSPTSPMAAISTSCESTRSDVKHILLLTSSLISRRFSSSTFSTPPHHPPA